VEISAQVRYLIDLFGVAVFAISGALAAGRKQMDLLGVAVLAVVTAIGGGTLRDVLLDRHPIFWIADPTYLLVILAAAGFTWIYSRRVRIPSQNLLVGADAIGLAYFAIGGTQVAQALGLHWLIAIICGAMTGAAGGIIRDVLSAEIPFVLRPGELYASAAILGSGLYLTLESMGIARAPAAYLGMAAVIAVRFAALAWQLRLPAFRVD
jgi:uncharacterized membrane protein YeiH